MVTTTAQTASTPRAGDGDRLAKLARVACDPDAPDGERDCARRAFVRLATRAGLLDPEAELPKFPRERNGRAVHRTPHEEQAQFEAICPATAASPVAPVAPSTPRIHHPGNPPQRRRSTRRAPAHGPRPHRCPLFDHAMDRWVTAAIVGAGGVAGAAALLVEAHVIIG